MNQNATPVQPTTASVAMRFAASPGKPKSSLREPRTIKRLVRHRITRLYFTHEGWTADPRQAVEFADCLQAAQTCARRNLTDVDLALHLGPGTLDFFSTPLR